MQDLRDAFRSLKAAPVVSAVAILSLALGIGANTAIFSILDSLLLRSLPVEQPHRLAMVSQGTSDRWFWTNPIWEAVRERRDLFGGAFAYSTTRFNLAPAGQTEFVEGLWASGGYFHTLGVPALLGRTFTEIDDMRGGGPDGPVAVISHGFWQQRFGGAADVVGRTLSVERVPFTIVGVTPPEFFGTEVGRTFDVAIPIGTEPLIRGGSSVLDRRSTWWLSVMVRLGPAQTLASASTALRGVQPQIREETLPTDWREDEIQHYLGEALALQAAANGGSRLRDRYSRPLLTIMVVVGLVLLVACANVANLLLARGTARRRELSVRLALGASRARLARQLLTESLALSAAGALLGLVFAFWGSRLLVRQLSTAANTVFLDLSLDWRVLTFTALVAVATALLFGTAPALRASRVGAGEALREQGRGVAGDARFSLGNLLVVAQVALSLVLLVAAGLFVRTFSSLANLPLGFERAPVLVANVGAQAAQVEPDRRYELFRRLTEAAASLPGVASASPSVVTPVSGSTWQFAVDVPGSERADTDRGTFVNIIGPDWFRTYGTRLLAGRDFTERDAAGSPPVAIVNETFARKFMDGTSPLGRRVIQPASPGRPAIEYEIVGYVEDAIYRSLREPVPPTLYLAAAQLREPSSFMAIGVRAAAGSPALLTRSLTAAFTDVNRDVTITFRPLGEQVDASLAQERMVAMLSGFFGALALLLAGLGLYGVTSYAVSRRRTELGIRLALGAAPSSVMRLVLGRVALLVAIGVIAGGTISLWAARFITALLHALEPHDPATLAWAVAVLGAIAALAGWLPARRASRLDPARVLREG